MINGTAIKLEFSSLLKKLYWVQRLADYPALANIGFKILLPRNL
jgi:hypothetical protein